MKVFPEEEVLRSWHRGVIFQGHPVCSECGQKPLLGPAADLELITVTDSGTVPKVIRVLGVAVESVAEWLDNHVALHAAGFLGHGAKSPFAWGIQNQKSSGFQRSGHDGAGKFQLMLLGRIGDDREKTEGEILISLGNEALDLLGEMIDRHLCIPGFSEKDLHHGCGGFDRCDLMALECKRYGDTSRPGTEVDDFFPAISVPGDVGEGFPCEAPVHRTESFLVEEIVDLGPRFMR